MIRLGRVAGAGVLGIAFLAGCKVDQAAFENRIFACDPSAKDPGCGTDSTGDPMVCYPASLLDGTDFCASSCGDTAMSLPDGNQCVEGGAELAACDPATPNSCGGSALGCLRTDVTTDEGVCTTMIPCTADTDCKDPVRSTCATTFLTQLYAHNTSLKANNLYCLQKNCQSGASACSPGQSCLPLLVEASAHAPDICVPNCDAQQNCPPNHVCFQKISGPANPAICIPGLLGFICESDINCLVGKCLSDGDPDQQTGLDLCTITCNSDADCAAYDSNQGTFACVPRADGKSYCESPYSYRGNACRTDDDCVRNGVRDTSSSCYFPTPPEKATDLGACLRPPVAGDCAPRAGIGQTPVPFYTPAGAPATACFPGFFGLPCLGNANCAGDMTCRQAIPNDASSSICTTLCQTDADCAADRWTAGQSFCAASGVCAPLLGGGKPCLSNSQCQSNSCQQAADAGAGAGGTCLEPAP
ncbi:MAG TPA: hypothetical protein VHO06_24310 [Polyangia bacterium]|nr:hypothetical protein [Polyangia bacterium]